MSTLLPLPVAVLSVLSLWSPAAWGAQEGPGDLRAPLPEGITPEIEYAIERGIQFLIRNQAADGSWEGEGGAYPVAMTALSGIALLATGSTATRGPFSPAIRRSTEFLVRASGDDGLFRMDRAWESRPMYGHAFCMLFLAQVLGQEESLERREELRRVLRSAVDLTIRAQSEAGGWYYTPRSSSDEGTLTVTMMQGLRACRDAGIHVPKAVIDRGVKYIEGSVNPDGGVRYMRNRGRDEVRQGVTCASVVALWSAGRYEDPLLKRIVGYMDRNIRPQWDTYSQHATYVQFYLGQARFLLGGERWRDFYRKESKLLLQDQETDGSWLTEEERNHGVGSVYSTAIALIVLQLPYNRLPPFQR